MPTTQESFNQALKTVRANGVRVKQNVMVCCPGCVSDEDLNLKDADTPYAYSFGGQDFAYAWDGNGNAVTRSSKARQRRRPHLRLEEVADVSFHWGNGSAQVLFDAFTAQGFDVEWDGDEYSVVTVTLL